MESRLFLIWSCSLWSRFRFACSCCGNSPPNCNLYRLSFSSCYLESFPGFLYFFVEKLRGVPGDRFAAPDILLHEKGAQAGSDPHGDLGILVLEGKDERILFFDAHLDPLPHLAHQGGGGYLPALFLEKTQLVDHSHEAGTTEDILLKHFEAIAGPDVDGGPDHPLGYGRRDDEELHRGLVQVRCQNAIDDRPDVDEEDGKQDHPFPPPEDLQEFVWFHIGAQWHDSPLIDLVRLPDRYPEKSGVVVQRIPELAVGRLPVQVSGEIQAGPLPSPVTQTRGAVRL